MINVLLASDAPAATNPAAHSGVGTDYPVAILTALILAYLGYLILDRVAQGDSYANLRKVMRASLILHLVCAPLQILVTDRFYHGVADWVRYVNQGAALSYNLRAGDFTTSGTGIGKIIGDGATSIFGGVIMTVVGPNKLAAFFVASFLSFVGSVFLYLAFKVTFPEANRGRYALLLFLFPSMLFWTADISKETGMLVGLGLAAYGVALILSGRALGYVYAIVGGALALVIRPDELVILAVAFALAMVVRGLFRQGRAFRPLRVAASVVVVVGFVVLTGTEAAHFVHAAGGNGLSGTLNQVGANNQGVGAGFGSSAVPYSSNPLYYLRDVYTVLFDPPPFLAHSVTQLAAAAENTLILVVILLSFRQLRCLFRVSLQRPYVFVCLIYSVMFMYAFAALGNLGLITRERTLLLPFLFVLLCVPLAPEGQHPYPWQLPRNQRRPIAGSDQLAPADRDDDGEWTVVDDAAGAGAQEWSADSVEDTQTADWSPAEWVPDT